MSVSVDVLRVVAVIVVIIFIRVGCRSAVIASGTGQGHVDPGRSTLQEFKDEVGEVKESLARGGVAGAVDGDVHRGVPVRDEEQVREIAVQIACVPVHHASCHTNK